MVISVAPTVSKRVKRPKKAARADLPRILSVAWPGVLHFCRPHGIPEVGSHGLRGKCLPSFGSVAIAPYFMTGRPGTQVTLLVQTPGAQPKSVTMVREAPATGDAVHAIRSSILYSPGRRIVAPARAPRRAARDQPVSRSAHRSPLRVTAPYRPTVRNR